MTLPERIVAALQTVRDPEMPVNVYDLGLIYAIDIGENGRASIVMTLTAPNCPVAGLLPAEVDRAVRAVSGVRDVCVDLTFDPPWTRQRMSFAAQVALGIDDPAPLVNIRL